jgi:predicted nucleic acid-binding protein
VKQIVDLDSGPVGLVTNPKSSKETKECNQWLEILSTRGVVIVLPEIIDYEIRRELLRADKVEGLHRLDILKATSRYAALTTPTILRAAGLWAAVRKQGKPTSDDKSLDIDVILAAQALELTDTDTKVVVATTNVGHLERFVEAHSWRDIAPPPPVQGS